MALHNSEVANSFTELADLLELESANPFRVRAYRNVARTISASPESLADKIARGDDLTELAGVGKDLAGKIEILVKTGKLPCLEEARKRIPPGLRDLLRVPGLGPKRVRVLCDDLHIQSLQDLKAAADKGLIHEHRGFGIHTEQKICTEVGRLQAMEIRYTLEQADQIVPGFVSYLRGLAGVRDAVAAGSYRRRRETVGDIDLLVTTGDPSEELMRQFVQFEEVAAVPAMGQTKASVQLRSGIQADIRLVDERCSGSALVYFTGSKAHNIHLRKLGQAKGLKINEYGVFTSDKEMGARTEQEVYHHVGLPYIEPELREDRGEIEAGRDGTLPRLIQLSDIRGDLHCHTTESDGRSSLAEMIAAAKAKGYEYLAVSDHSKRLAMARGLDERRLAQQIGEIDRLNANESKFKIFRSCEVDILEDGRLDLPNSILNELDLVTASIHYRFNLTREKQTDRLLRTIDNPAVKILGHPTGRLINQRDGYGFDTARVMKHAKDRGVWMEINAQPERLDLDDVHARMARDLGVMLVICSDAHHASELHWMRYGVDQARRGWLEKENVANALPLRSLIKMLKN